MWPFSKDEPETEREELARLQCEISAMEAEYNEITKNFKIMGASSINDRNELKKLAYRIAYRKTHIKQIQESEADNE